MSMGGSTYQEGRKKLDEVIPIDGHEGEVCNRELPSGSRYAQDPRGNEGHHFTHPGNYAMIGQLILVLLGLPPLSGMSRPPRHDWVSTAIKQYA